MKATEFNNRLNELFAQAWEEGLTKGGMTPFEALGVLDANHRIFAANVERLVMTQAAAQQPIIMARTLPPRRPSNGQ